MVRMLYFVAWIMLMFGLSACANTDLDEQAAAIVRDDILTLSQPVEKHTQRPTHLPLTNSIAMRGEWDIFIIDDDKFSEPYGTLSVMGGSHRLNMPCSIPHNFSSSIKNGKFADDYGSFKARILSELLGTVDKTCLNTPGVNYTRSLLEGTFYGDRKKIWFDGPYMSFIAKRSDRIIPDFWLNKYLAVESCILDHPKIGADKYWGYQIFARDSNQPPIYTLAGDGIKYWDDCKPDYKVDVKTVKYGLPFLDAKVLEIKAEISAHSEGITIRRVNGKTNSIDGFTNPDWVKKNQEFFKRLTDEHPYVAWREGLIPDEVLSSGKY